ncbi:MAG: PAS domain-containing sensor histidine kinase [Candidatus Kapabacteria bacterium]|nr:PAS domain-containing sensor histidine kinase [Ignavibacteriota bacterium]MCW5884615.1 PAS domain-containing sensor histidine kinase [Candidatus Kapabacteria bacterium]
MVNQIKTYYAPAEKLKINDVKKQNKVLETLPQIKFFLDTIPNAYFILNEQRQIIYANKIALEALDVSQIENILGMRFGEVLSCTHAKEMPGGCGTAEACQHCGAVNAIQTSLKNKSDIRECRISTDSNDKDYDFRVWSNPYEIAGEKFILFSIADISDEKRRRALETIFFHDVLNTAGGIKGISSLIHDFPEEVNDFKDILYDSSKHLINEIQAQRDLANAENNDLKLHIVKLNSKYILELIKGIYSSHDIAMNKTIEIDPKSEYSNFESDEPLLVRVLSNMTKNALEASEENQVVTIKSEIEGEYIKFSIHNQKFMSREIQLQIFQRSFSTKGAGRGLGTYSIKLLGEKYLKGKVGFDTSRDFGTTFYGKFPIKLVE